MINVPAGAQIAKLRAKRLSMLSRIGLGELIWPWMWPLHMMAVGSRRQRIESIPGASLAVTGGSGGQAPDKAIRRIGIATYAVQFLGTLAALLVVIFTAGALQIVALITAAALYGPVLVEGVAMLINIIIRPGQLMLGHRRKQLAQGNQKVLILTSYVRDPVAPKGTARTLLTRLQRQWQAERVIVIGYPANRALQRLYRDLGAIGDGWRGRRMKFDYRDQPSPHMGECGPVGSGGTNQRGESGERPPTNGSLSAATGHRSMSEPPGKLIEQDAGRDHPS